MKAMDLCRLMAACALVVGLNALPAYAQQTGTQQQTTTERTAETREEMDWGWIGLLGLLGLAGLMRRREEPTTYREPTSTGRR